MAKKHLAAQAGGETSDDVPSFFSGRREQDVAVVSELLQLERRIEPQRTDSPGAFKRFGKPVEREVVGPECGRQSGEDGEDCKQVRRPHVFDRIKERREKPPFPSASPRSSTGR